MFTTQQLKQILYLTLGFIITIQLGVLLSESVKAITAHQLGYTAHYWSTFGTLYFVNSEMQAQFQAVADVYDEDRSKFTDTSEWQELVEEHRNDNAQIELSGLLFTVIVSIIGVSLFYWQRYRKKNIHVKDWISLFLGLFFMKGVFFYTVTYILIGGILCGNASLWQTIGIDLYTLIKSYLAIGWIALAVILYSLPSDFRWKFIISGIAGVPLGIALWLYVVGDLVL